MKLQNMNQDWKFWEEKDAFALVWNIPESARDITLPHDAMMEKEANPQSQNGGNTGFRDGAVYNYVKILTVPEEYEDKTLLLKFEGIYMNAFVYVNGQLAGKRPYGYSQFYVPMNDFLKYGEENEIRIQVRNGAMANSRWYSGGGIYRDVSLCIADLAYFVPDGVFVRTEEASKELALVRISSELKNRGHRKKNLRMETVILDENEVEVARDVTPVTLFAGEAVSMSRRLAVEEPRLWDEEHPSLYTCVAALFCGEELLDESRTVFGIRTLTVDAKRGFRVNGQTVKLRGACIHHDSGLIGAATYEEARYRQIRKLKEAGFNAVRMSHHPMSDAMLRACDRLGMYVMDECFDMWSRCKSDYDYGMQFEEWWERDVEEMVRKDRNHPSVILYSLGNEIPEIGTDYGADLCRKLSEKVRESDDTRFTLASVNGVFAAGDAISEILQDIAKAVSDRGEVLKGNVNNFMSLMDAYMDEIVVHKAISHRLEKACADVDIAGYNYMTARYEEDARQYPNRVIVGSETYPPEIARNWEIIKRSDHVIGDFTWTGWDYIGEAGVGIPAYRFGEGGFGAQFPCQLAYCGDFDLTGFRRPASYFREIVFGLRKKPYITVQDPSHYGENLIKTPWVISDSAACWNYEGMEGKPVIVEVYAAGAETELFVNGKSLGKKPAGQNAGYRVLFDAVYEPGTLTAVSYEDGEEIGRAELHTAKEKKELVFGEDLVGEELIYLPIEVRDEDGILSADVRERLEIAVEGGASLIGFGSGDPKTAYSYTGTVTETWHGRALAILKRHAEGGAVKVTVRSQTYGTRTHEIKRFGREGGNS